MIRNLAFTVVVWLLPLLALSQLRAEFTSSFPKDLEVTGIHIFVDSSKGMSVDQVRLPIHQPAYIPLNKLTMATKFQRGQFAYWIRLSVVNRLSDSLQMGFRCGLFEQIEIYRNYSSKPEVIMGTRISMEKNPNPTFPQWAATILSLAPEEEAFFWIGIKNEIEINRPFQVELFEPLEKLNKELNPTIGFYVSLGSFFILLLFLSLYNCLQYLENRDQAYLYYGLYLLSLFIFYSRDFDMNSPVFHIWPLGFQGYTFLSPIVLGSFMMYVMFLEHFLEAKEKIPKLHMINQTALWSCGTFFIAERIIRIFDPYMAWAAYGYFKIGLLGICGFLLYTLLTNRSPLSFYVLCGTLILVLSSLATALMSFLPKHLYIWWDITYFPQYGGILLEILFLTLGLAYKSRFAEAERSRGLLELQLKEAESVHLRKLDQQKTRFFTSITHEFRTPLTVILGLLDEIKRNPTIQLVKRLDIIHSNGQNLLQLINQLLDLARVDAEGMKLNLVQDDVVSFLRALVDSLHSHAISQNIGLQFHSEQEQLEMDFDPTQLQRIMTNLLSNAFKFTPEYGNILVVTKVISLKDHSLLEVKVTDSGHGIPKDELPYIFNRFYQVENFQARKGEGSGIGLTLVKELIGLMKGSIEVESKIDKGTIFTFCLPITHNVVQKASSTEVVLSPSIYTSKSQKEKAFTQKIHEEGKPIALIIEDNADVVYYLQTCLEDSWQTHTADDGLKGIEKALAIIPDVIITDVMMPEMNGYKVVENLKSDLRTNHIPMLMLTARATQNDKIEGLEKGADAYLVKPFNKEELLVRLDNFMLMRQRMQAHLKLDQSNHKSSSPEQVFLNKLNKIIQSNLDDSEFNSASLAQEIGMDRSQLHRKLKAITDQPTSLYMRSYRLKKAHQLLLNTNLTVSEIAWKTGFKSLAWFDQAYKKEYNETPGNTRKKV